MTWTKLGDEFGDAAAALSDAAHRTHVDALNWSNRLLLDLVVPKLHLRRFAFSPAVDVPQPDTCPVVRELIEGGWWEDRDEAWYIGLRWPEWQRDRAQVERTRGAASERKRRERAHARDDHSLCLPTAPCSSPPRPVPGPAVSHGRSHAVSHAVTGRCGIRGHEHAGRRADGQCSACFSDRPAVSA